MRLLQKLNRLRRVLGNLEKWTTDTHLGAYQLILTQSLIDSKNKRLCDLGFKVYSQWEEDGMLLFLASSLSINKPRILEIGAGNFLESNSRFLCEYRNAAAYLVDTRDDLWAGVIQSDLQWKTHIRCDSTWITSENALLIQDSAKSFLGHIDILSLDIDGQDYWVLEKLNLSAIQVIVCEYNPLFGPKVLVTVPEIPTFTRSKGTKNLFWGASLNAFISFLDKRGFVFAGSNIVGNNAFFVRKDLGPRIEIVWPGLDDLSSQVDYLIRESIDINNDLDLLESSKSLELILKEKVVDLTTGRIVELSTILE